MNVLLEGVQKFTEKIFPEQKELFDTLANGQKPHTMFITCSDSRIDPNLITQTKPGEIFVLRNAGNIVPPFGASNGGEEATIEFAIEGLGVQNIVICGHSQCGAMKALAGGADLSGLPSTASWLGFAEATKKRVGTEPKADLDKIIEENVLVQIENLKTHPSVSAALFNKKINIFAWVYQFERGDFVIYNSQHRKFISCSELSSGTNQSFSNFEL